MNNDFELFKNKMYQLETEDSAAQMVADSVESLVFLLGIIAAVFLFFYLLPKFFPRADKSTLRQNHAILFGIALLSSLPFLSEGIHFGHDAYFHLMRIDAIFEGLKNGQFPVRLSGIFNWNTGLPVNVFYGDYLLYLPAVLRFFDFSLSAAYQIYGVFIQFLSTYVAWFCFLRIFAGNRIVALLTTAALITAHYHLTTVFIRFAVGEYTAMAFFPLILLALWRIYGVDSAKQTAQFYAEKTAIILALGITGCITSHMISTAMTMLAIFLLALIFYKKTFSFSTLKTFLLGAVLTLFLSAAFWVPFLDFYYNVFTELRATGKFFVSFLQPYAVAFAEYFAVFGGWDLLPQKDEAGVLPRTPGFVLITAFLVAILLMIFKKDNRKIRFAFYSALFFLWFGSNLFPWDFLTNFSFFAWLTHIQFAWRFLSIAVLLLALLFGLLLLNTPEQHRTLSFAFAGFAMLLSTLSFFSDYVEHTIPKTVAHAWGLPHLTGGATQLRNSSPQYTPFGTEIDALNNDFTPHNAQLQFVQEKGLTLLLFAQATGENSAITVPRVFYPYYHAASESGELAVEIAENNLTKILLPQSFNGKVFFYFSPPWFWRMAEVLTFLSFLLLVFAIFKIKQKSTVNG